MKKFILIFILLTAMLLLISSCAKETVGNTSTSENTTANTGDLTDTDAVVDKWAQEPNNLPQMNFNGREFNVIVQDEGEDRAYNKFAVEEQTGDAIIDALYKRNLAVEERYNIKIKFTNHTAPSEIARKSILAGDNQYDLIVDFILFERDLASRKLLADLYTVPYVRDGLDKSWWDHALKRDLSINNKLFFGAGHIVLRDKLRTSCILFNKKLGKDLGIDYPYQYVYNDTWTLDKLIELSKGVNRDLNGDGVIDQYDQWGLLGFASFAAYVLNTSGEKAIGLNKDGIPEITMNAPRALDVINKILAFCAEKEAMFFTEDIKNAENIWYKADEYFAEDRFFMRIGIVEHVLRLRDMVTDFGVVPMPKFDERQENYYSHIDNGAYVVGIPQNADLEFSGLITEALAYESGSTLMPAFYDVTLTSKQLRDDESEGMLDIIFANRSYDIGFMYGIGSFPNILNDLVSRKSTDFVSAYDKAESSNARALEKFIENYDKD